MTGSEIYANSKIAAARAVASDKYAKTFEDINHICASYGFRLSGMTDDEIIEFFNLVDMFKEAAR